MCGRTDILPCIRKFSWRLKDGQHSLNSMTTEARKNTAYLTHGATCEARKAHPKRGTPLWHWIQERCFLLWSQDRMIRLPQKNLRRGHQLKNPEAGRRSTKESLTRSTFADTVGTFFQKGDNKEWSQLLEDEDVHITR